MTIARFREHKLRIFTVNGAIYFLDSEISYIGFTANAILDQLVNLDPDPGQNVFREIDFQDPVRSSHPPNN